MILTKEALNLINNSKNVAIVGHVRTDADCLGSASALKSTLIKLGKQVDIFCDSEISENYLFLPHIDQINPTISDYDLIIIVDCSDRTRTGKYVDLFKSKKSILFDHHCSLGNEEFATYNFRQEISSTAELLYSVIIDLGVEIDEKIATGLYAGMISDTGGFLHSNTQPSTHIIVGELMKKLPKFTDINYYLMQKRTPGQVELLKRALNNLSYICDGKVAITYLTEKDFRETKTINSETFNIVNVCNDISTVEMGILISEKSHNLFACSLRGRNRNVSIIANAFGGGGHKFASGCNIFGTPNAIKQKIEKVINENYDRICEC